MWLGEEGPSKKAKGLLDTDNNVGVVGMGVRRCINGNGKKTIKKVFCIQIDLMYAVRDTSCLLTH